MEQASPNDRPWLLVSSVVEVINPFITRWKTQMIRMALLLAAFLVVSSAQTADKPKETPSAVEQKLHGEWKGGLCMGELILRADGTFMRQHYTPGNIKLTGTWKLIWNALPPTLALTCETSDEPGARDVGRTSKIKLVQLDDENLAYEDPEYQGGQPILYTRLKK